MKTLSLKLDDSIFEDTDKLAKELKKPRNRYINEAVAFFNELKKKELIKTQLEYESKLVRKESMKILNEFESLEDED